MGVTLRRVASIVGETVSSPMETEKKMGVKLKKLFTSQAEPFETVSPSVREKGAQPRLLKKLEQSQRSLNSSPKGRARATEQTVADDRQEYHR